MSSYVFLTSEFVPNADASGICVYNVAKKLVENGNRVFVICEGRKNTHRFQDKIEIFEVEATFFKQLQKKANDSKSWAYMFILNIVKVLRRIVKAFTIFRFPNVSAKRAKKVYRVLEQINNEKKIDVIIGGFRPYDNIYAVTRFKNKHKNVKSIVVYWDLIRSKNPFGNSLYKLFDYLCYRNEQKVFNINDRILIPKSGMKAYTNARFDFAKEKVFYFDFPVFTESMPVYFTEELTKENINLTCIGTIDGENRSAFYFLKLAKILKEETGKNIKVHIIGNFTDMKAYEEFKDRDFVEFHGSVDYDDIPQYIKESDFLINIGNKVTYDMIPSKIFQYFSSCKPIINFVAHKDDKSLEYFNKYPLKCNILEYENNVERDIRILKNYVFDINLITPDYSYVESLYQSNKPEFFVENFLK